MGNPGKREGRKKVLFSADDFGASRGVNQGTVEAFRKGPVRRASILATGLDLEGAARLAEESPGLQVGLHFSLSLGRPLSEGGRFLAGGGRTFPPLERVLVRALAGRLDPRAVREEMEAQWEALLQVGFAPLHLDGHQHVHLFPGVLQALSAFLEDHRLERVRLLGEPLLLPPRRRLLPRLLLSRFSRRAEEVLAERGVLGKERAVGLCLWQAPDLEGAAKTLLQALPPGEWEVFTHPRYPDPDFDALDPETRKGPDPGRRELELLTRPSFLDWLRDQGFLREDPPGNAPSGPTTGSGACPGSS